MLLREEESTFLKLLRELEKKSKKEGKHYARGAGPRPREGIVQGRGGEEGFGRETCGGGADQDCGEDSPSKEVAANSFPRQGGYEGDHEEGRKGEKS